jgi:OmpA-OmpF porin, OOP family
MTFAKWCSNARRLLFAKIFVTLMLLIVSFGAGVSAQGVYKDSRIDAFGGVFAPPTSVSSRQTQLIFYRVPQHSSVPGAASVYVNGAYHTSLVSGGFSVLCMPPGEVELGVKSVQVGRSVRGSLDSVTVNRVQAGSAHYFRVVQVEPMRQVLTPVPVQTALAEIQNTLEQIHTVSRVRAGAPCETQSAPALAASQSQPLSQPQAQPTVGRPSRFVTVVAGASFEFGRSDFDAITARGRISLDNFVQSLSRDFARVDSIHVVGHTDPFGNTNANLMLSENRAQTVRQYFRQSGLAQVNITSEGRGPFEPIVSGCGASVTPQSVQCHEPNRRVVIEVVGTLR